MEEMKSLDVQVTLSYHAAGRLNTSKYEQVGIFEEQKIAFPCFQATIWSVYTTCGKHVYFIYQVTGFSFIANWIGGNHFNLRLNCLIENLSMRNARHISKSENNYAIWRENDFLGISKEIWLFSVLRTCRLTFSIKNLLEAC